MSPCMADGLLGGLLLWVVLGFGWMVIRHAHSVGKAEGRRETLAEVHGTREET